MMPTFAARNARGRQAGVGMLEVLIAVLIVSIGFLGMAALQAKALSTNNSAMARSMATVASYSILDAMRSDVANAEGGLYNGTVTANACGTAPAAGASLATEQLYLWCQQLGSALGALSTTQGTITCNSTGNCTVAITFDDSRSGKGGSATQTVSSVTQL